MSTANQQLVDAVAAAAEPLYDAALPYHCFGHARRTAHHAAALVDRVRRHGVEVDADVVVVAALLHDAGYATDPATVGYPHREAYAVALSRQVLTGMGCPAGFIDAVAGCISATHIDLAPVTAEQALVRAADLAEIGGPYLLFEENSAALRREAELLGGHSIDVGRWKTQTAQVIGRYLAGDIRLTTEHDDEHGVSRWHQSAAVNLATYLAA